MKKILLCYLVGVLLAGCTEHKSDPENSVGKNMSSTPKVVKEQVETLVNTKGDQIALYSDGTWAALPKKASNEIILNNLQSIVLSGEDGNKKKVSVDSLIQIKGSDKKYATKQNAEQLISFASMMIKLQLKNEYSFVPKDAAITFNGKVGEIILNYASKNAYGAELSSVGLVKYDLSNDHVVDMKI